MGRFNANKYDPKNDSSAGHQKDGVLVLAIASEGEGADRRFGCPCGCMTMPKGKHATFAMGHDARLRGKLIRAHLTGTKVIIITLTPDGKIERERKPVTALKVASQHDWEKYLESASLDRDGKNRQLLRKAIGSKRLIKVGRWEKTGQVVAVFGEAGDAEYEVEYVTKSGDTKKVRVPASEAPLAEEQGEEVAV